MKSLIKLQINAYDLLISAFIKEDVATNNNVLQSLIDKRDGLEELIYKYNKLVDTLEYTQDLL